MEILALAKEVVNAKQLGLIPDGSTDNAPALQINIHNGKRIMFDPVDYLFGSPIAVSL